MKRCLIVTSPEFHAIVYVISAEQRIEEGDTNAMTEFEKMIGNKMYGYAIIVFTHVEPEDIEKRIKESAKMVEFCGKCRNRYISFGTNGNSVNPSLVEAFDRKLESLVKSNAISLYYQH